MEASSLSEFVARRAWLALERAERLVRGNRYKVPKFVEFRDELPKTMVGKILRRVLIDEEKKKQAAQ